MNKIIHALALGIFGIITTEFGIVGILPKISHNFNVPTEKPDFLVSLFALVVAVLGPFMTLWLTRTFDVPEVAVHLFESAACKNKAFLYEERILGLQFHFEVTEKAVNQMIHHGKKELSLVSAYVQGPEEMEKKIYLCEENNKFMYSIITRLSEQENEKEDEQLIRCQK